jgi:hypothetical protein
LDAKIARKEETSVAHPDLDTLLNPLLSFAQEMLAKRGTFLPFGMSIKADGGFGMAAGYTGEESPEPGAIIDLLVQGFQMHAATGGIRAAGICVDMRVFPPGKTEKTEAICAQLEHAEGECVDIYLPYRKGRFGRFKFGQLFAGSRDSRIFGMRPSDG